MADIYLAGLDGAFSRAAELGGSIVAFVSGDSRQIPEGWSRDEALERFDEAWRRASEVAERYGITIAIEPLNRGETNLVNTVAEGAAVVQRVSRTRSGSGARFLAQSLGRSLESERVTTLRASNADRSLRKSRHRETGIEARVRLPGRVMLLVLCIEGVI